MTLREHGKVFFSMKRASDFADWLKSQGAVDVHIWGGKDAFNQTIYSVRWWIEVKK